MEKPDPLCKEDKDEIYFGEQGRNMFYQRCQWLQQQGEIVSAQSRDSVSKAYFDKSKDTVVFSRKGWKGNRRNKHVQGGQDTQDFDDNSSIGTMQTRSTLASRNSDSRGGTSRFSGDRITNSRMGREGRRSISSTSSNNNSLLTTTRNIYVDDMKLLSPRTRFISSCMKEGDKFSHRRYISL